MPVDIACEHDGVAYAAVDPTLRDPIALRSVAVPGVGALVAVIRRILLLREEDLLAEDFPLGALFGEPVESPSS